MKVIVYTKTVCPECNKIKFALNNLPIEADIEYRNIEEKNTLGEEIYLEEFTNLGFSSVPVTVFPDGQAVVGFEIGDLQEKFGL